MPRLDLMDGGRDLSSLSADPPALFIGSGDTRRGGTAGTGFILDGLTAGSQSGTVAGTNVVSHITGFYDEDGNELPSIGPGMDLIGTIIATDTTAAWGSGIGLIRLGGEVMAIESSFTIADRQAFHGTTSNNPPSMSRYRRIIGRGLLGSQPLSHSMAYSYDPGSTTDIRYVVGPPLLHLPIGPVRKLSTGIDPNFSGVVSSIYSNPHLLGSLRAQVGIRSNSFQPQMAMSNLGCAGYGGRRSSIGHSRHKAWTAALSQMEPAIYLLVGIHGFPAAFLHTSRAIISNAGALARAHSPGWAWHCVNTTSKMDNELPGRQPAPAHSKSRVVGMHRALMGRQRHRLPPRIRAPGKT